MIEDDKGAQGEVKREEPDYAKDRVIVKFKDQTAERILKASSFLSRSRLLTLPREYNVKEMRRLFEGQKEEDFGLENIYILKIERKDKKKNIDIPALIKELEKNPNVVYAEPDYKVEIQMVPDDPRYTDQWPHRKISSEQAWDITAGLSGVIIGIIDTGIYFDHPDLSQNIWINEDEIPANGIDDDGNGYVDDVRGYDFVNGDGDPVDDNGHGTHVAGIADAVGNNGIGIAGVSWNCKLMAVKGLGSNGLGYYSTLAQCIRYAADNGARVLNNSWGPKERFPSNRTIEEAIDYAYSKNCVVVFAAGNRSDDAAYYSPANYPKVLAVAATDANDQKASFSNYGATVDIAAPGYKILSTVPPSGSLGDPSLYKYLNGTSMACPHVAGLAALLLAIHPQYANSQIEWIIKESVDILPGLESSFYPGFGRINLSAAVNYPQIPPRLIAGISTIEIDYANRRIRIMGTAEGEDFSHYNLEYRDAADTWTNISSSSTPIDDGEFCDWQVLDKIPVKALLRLTVYAGGGREEKAYNTLFIRRYLEPEDPIYIYNTTTGPRSQGLIRRGDDVSFVGRHFGDYHLEWKENTSSDWNSTGFDYDYQGADVIGKWDTSVVDADGAYFVRLSDSLGDDQYAEIILDSSIKEGWPVVMDPYNILGQIDSSATHSKVGNLDEDPYLEVVTIRTFDHSARIYIFDDSGAIKPGWPKIIYGESGYSYYPTLADIDEDGVDEIFISTGRTNGRGFINTLYCFNANGDIIFKKAISGPDWQGDTLRDPIIVCDLNRDSAPEIIYRHSDGVYIFDQNGNDLPSWPKAMRAYSMIITAEGVPNYMAIGNFDDDIELELVVRQFASRSGNYTDHAVIHIFNLDGSYVAGWPKIIEGKFYPGWFSCGDMNGDGYDDIAMPFWEIDTGKMTLYAFKNDGTILFVKDIKEDFPFCIMADLNKDGKAEVIFSNDKIIEVVDYSGSNIPGWPCVLSETTIMPRLVCDIDGDGEPEIIGKYSSKKTGEVTYYKRLFVINADGTINLNNPLHDKIIPVWTGSLYYCDIDSDGVGDMVLDGLLPIRFDHDTDILSLSYFKPTIYVLTTGYPYKSKPHYWPTYFADNSNTARYVMDTANNIISIELEDPSVWELNSARMGELRSNVDIGGNPIHAVKNTGDAPVNVEIKYGPQDGWGIKPGLEQALDTFITKLGNDILPPDSGRVIASIQPGASAPLALTYGAPTKVSQGITSMTTIYELRAYKATE